MKTDNYPSKELKKIFVKYISMEAMVATGLWKGYRTLVKGYNIKQIESGKGLSFKAPRTMIHQVKSWPRTTYSWVSGFNTERYPGEFCYRINRSEMKTNIFNNLIGGMVAAQKKYQAELICS